MALVKSTDFITLTQPIGPIQVHVQTIASVQDVSQLNVEGNTEMNIYGLYVVVNETIPEIFSLLDNA